MARMHRMEINISSMLFSARNSPTKFGEHIDIQVPPGMDHVEALAILVTEIAHFEMQLNRALKAGIVEDAPPAGV